MLGILSLRCCSAYLHDRVLIRYRQTACSLKVTHKHWPLSCSLSLATLSPPPLFYILWATHWEIQAAQRCLCDQHWLLFEVQTLRLYPQRTKERGGREGTVYWRQEVPVCPCFGLFLKKTLKLGYNFSGEWWYGKACVVLILLRRTMTKYFHQRP